MVAADRPLVAVRLLLLLLLLSGCALVGNQARFEMTFPGGGDGPPAMPVVLEDRTGLVREIGLPPLAGDFHFPDGVTNMPGRMDQLAVTWLSGECTDRSAIVFEPTADGYLLAVTVIDRPGGCFLIGYGRTLAIQLTAPVEASRVRFEEVFD